MKFIKKLMNSYHINSQPVILALFALGFLSVILAATIMVSAQNTNSPGDHAGQSDYASQSGVGITEAPDSDSEDKLLAVVQELDTDNQMITLFDVNGLTPYYLSYNGGTEVADQYGQLISLSNITPGIMVDVTYDPAKNQLSSMNISKIAWEYAGVNNMDVDTENQIMMIASKKYKYNKDLFVTNDNEVVSVDDLTPQDVLTVWGYQQTIWSVTVTKGHGVVKLEDYKDYLGDSISIGYESMLQITDDLAVTVREGTYNLTVENGQYSATKSVTIKRNKVTYVSLSDLGPIGLKSSEVTFDIAPEGADLYVDGKLTPYEDPVNLSYGVHSAVASLGGYTTYKGTINIKSETETININLPEATSDKDAAASQTNSGTDNSGQGSGSSTGSGSSSTDSNTGDNLSDGTASDGSTDGVKYAAGSTDYKLADGDSVDKDHRIYIKEPNGASVYLDSEYMGTAPCKFDKIIGSHVLTFIREGYETASYTVEVNDDNKDSYFTFPELAKKK